MLSKKKNIGLELQQTCFPKEHGKNIPLPSNPSQKWFVYA